MLIGALVVGAGVAVAAGVTYGLGVALIGVTVFLLGGKKKKSRPAALNGDKIQVELISKTVHITSIV